MSRFRVMSPLIWGENTSISTKWALGPRNPPYCTNVAITVLTLTRGRAAAALCLSETPDGASDKSISGKFLRHSALVWLERALCISLSRCWRSRPLRKLSPEAKVARRNDSRYLGTETNSLTGTKRETASWGATTRNKRAWGWGVRGSGAGLKLFMSNLLDGSLYFHFLHQWLLSHNWHNMLRHILSINSWMRQQSYGSILIVKIFEI